jgi:rhodanese-related sulfurtransferase
MILRRGAGFFALTILILATGCQGLDYRDPEVLGDLIESQREPYLLIDVRTAEEFRSGFIPTAVNIPHDEIGKSPPTEDRSALIILYCKSGGRAGIAEETMEELGFTNIYNFGGIGRWTGELETPE